MIKMNDLTMNNKWKVALELFQKKTSFFQLHCMCYENNNFTFQGFDKTTKEMQTIIISDVEVTKTIKETN